MRKMLALAVTGALAASLTACTVPDEELPVSTPTPTPTSEAKAEGAKAEPEAKEEAQRGSRENPLAPGEARKVGADSSFTVSASKTDYRDGYVVADFTVEVDWDTFNKQAESNGEEPGGPAQPFMSLDFVFMDKEGQTYRDYPIDYDTPDDYALMAGDMFEPAKSQTGAIPIEVPKDKVKGGVWIVSNVIDDRVFIAQKK